MHTSSRATACTIALACTACAVAPQALAQNYPAKPVRVVVGLAPGGGG